MGNINFIFDMVVNERENKVYNYFKMRKPECNKKSVSLEYVHFKTGGFFMQRVEQDYLKPDMQEGDSQQHTRHKSHIKEKSHGWAADDFLLMPQMKVTFYIFCA